MKGMGRILFRQDRRGRSLNEHAIERNGHLFWGKDEVRSMKYEGGVGTTVLLWKESVFVG